MVAATNTQSPDDAYPRVETRRLLLRALTLEDTDFIFQEWGDPVVTYYMWDEDPLQSREQAEEMLQSLQKPEVMPDFKWWGIELKAEGRLISTCGYCRWDRRHHRAEIGYDLDGVADEGQKYDVISGCAHVFPPEQVGKLRIVYEEARARTGDALTAVDEVIAFMDRDPGWVEGSRREGRVIYVAKKPANPQAYAEAQTDADKKRAYCFCPIIRNHLERGMPRSFCYCGAGWYRQQWEGATSKPVTVEIVQSILDGDDVCGFAIHLSDDV